jgi:hypothetical protein
LERCLEAGVVALVATASTVEPDETTLLESIFENFSKDSDVARELAPLLSGQSPNMDELRYLFEQAGYDPATLPGLKFEEAMTAFQMAFLAAATEEPTLQGTIQTNLLLAMTRQQQEMVEGHARTRRDAPEGPAWNSRHPSSGRGRGHDRWPRGCLFVNPRGDSYG